MQTTTIKIIGIATGILFLYCMLRFVLVVRTVRCQLNETHEPCPTETVAALHALIDQPLLYSDLPGLAEQALATHNLYLAAYSRQLPDTLLLEVTPTEYEFGVQTSTRTFVVTTKGHVLEHTIPAELPTLYLADHLITHNELPSQQLISTSKTALSTLMQLQLTFTKAEIISLQELRVELQDPEITVIVNPAQAQSQLQKVPVVLTSQAVYEIPEKLVELDMRFEMPVIRTDQLPATPEPTPSI